MKLVKFFVFISFCTSCQTIERDKTSDDIKVDLILEGQQLTQVAYETTIKPYQQYNYFEAVESLQAYLKKYPLSQHAPNVTLMLADSYFQLANYEQALKWYATVIEFNKGATESTAEALYKSGLCHEYLGNDAKAIATYTDALKRKEKLTFELAWLEIPARLAMTYVRLGEFK